MEAGARPESQTQKVRMGLFTQHSQHDTSELENRVAGAGGWRVGLARG